MEIEKQIAFDDNNLASFRKEWATFKQCPSENNLIYTANLKCKRQMGRWGMGEHKPGSLLLTVNI